MSDSKNQGENIRHVIQSLADTFDAELFACEQSDLEKNWHFKFDFDRSLAFNIYQFQDLLELYRRFCRRWEEHHNGPICVVERVRDKYLLPKINQFANDIEKSVKGGSK